MHREMKCRIIPLHGAQLPTHFYGHGKLLVNLTERTSRRISAQQQELDACAEKDRFKLWGDLISANIYLYIIL